MPDYEKGSAGIFVALKEHLPFARENATRVNQQAQQNHTDNPSTHVHELVDYLINIKNN